MRSKVLCVTRTVVSIIFLNLAAQASVGVGELFERVHPYRTVKTAKVLSVVKDLAGVPHVFASRSRPKISRAQVRSLKDRVC